MEGTVFTPSLEGMNHVKSEDGHMQTKPFLDVCKNVLPVIEKLGGALALVKSDVGRLENKYYSNPAKYRMLYVMINEEVDAKTAKGSSSCTNGLLWLTSYGFLVELFRNLMKHVDWTMAQACTDAYNKTLKKWHGWFARTSFTAAMKFAPGRKRFMEIIGSNGGDLDSDIQKFCAIFPPLLEENHKFLASVGMDVLRA